MASEPSPDTIKTLSDFTGVSHEAAIILLKKNNNDVARSADVYWQDPVGSLREDPNARTWEYQDNVPFDDGASTGAMPATRPPSRADNSNKVVDLSHTHAEATAAADKQMQDDEMNDPEMQRAINLSLGKPEMPEQESGITGAGQQFGPANRPSYDPAQWSMVPVATSRELIDHPSPSKRRRKEGQPAFLRPSKESGYLAALLTIYHSIPLAREALLMPPMKVLSYGYNSAWWSGSSDENSKSLSMELDQNADKDRINLLAELQCLMAFLDGTTRAYGSVDALTDLNAFRNFRHEASTSFSHFLEAWKYAAVAQHPQEQVTQIFNSTAVRNDAGSIQDKEMVCVEPIVNHIPGQLLVSLLDNTVWNDTVDELEDVWISQAAEIFTIRLFDPGQQLGGLDLTVPPIWYPDRYMESLRMQALRMREEVQEVQRQFNHCIAQQRRLTSFMGHDRRPIRARDVLEAAARLSKTALKDRYGEHQPSADLEVLNVSSVEEHIRAALQRIDDKIQLLEDRKEPLRARIQQIRMQYTAPGDNPDEPPHMKYVLQGVATKPEIMYVRERNQDLLGLDDEEDVKHQDYQWWRIEWPQSRQYDQAEIKPPTIGPMPKTEAEASDGTAATDIGDAPYSVVPVAEDDVIEAARTEHHSVVLVYANQNAMSFQGKPMSPPLRQFVEQDNVNFAKELREEADEQDDSSMTWETVPLAAGGAVRADREMTPMSTSTHRGEDGQPSPKRPRSSDDGWKPQEEGLPSYDEAVGSPVPEMQERSNKIGLYAEAMLEKYGNEDGTATNDQEIGEAVHVERAADLPR
ncbi:uncharacterized protein HMPREF1541_04819 [Cyphellophora europaea CBS 101466]|uniref:UBA domain-containing protein n=1 Tax=Cyphellophora europaea (strain CBS 101466) TaxID=1220924 RepID=W2RVS0_CYPE1|nr:uncharacterized protein HMPREF1541_04819 [Cyphellophora europaea CBS 101466]ETN40542.1 hypothetical protein HMPREF1541_04819 [Cyphellophora europaea CBS 101466]